MGSIPKDKRNTLDSKIYILIERYEPKKKKKVKGKPLRDPLTASFFEEIKATEILKGGNKKSWGRFKISCTIL